MKKVKFLTNAAGSYGLAHTGDELTLNPKLAEELQKKGLVKISGEAGKDAEESVAEKGSFRISDNTGKEKSVKIQATEKVSKAGPNKKK